MKSEKTWLRSHTLGLTVGIICMVIGTVVGSHFILMAGGRPVGQLYRHPIWAWEEYVLFAAGMMSFICGYLGGTAVGRRIG
jgi:hypothetical protein